MKKEFYITEKQQEDVGEMAKILLTLPTVEREILMANARAFKTRLVIASQEELVEA